MHGLTVIQRTVTIAGVAIGAAILVGSLAFAMRGLTPAATNAAATNSAQRVLRDINALDRTPPSQTTHLASWHAPRVPRVHPRVASLPLRVVTVTTVPTVVPAVTTAPAPKTAVVHTDPPAPPVSGEPEDGPESGQDD